MRYTNVMAKTDQSAFSHIKNEYKKLFTSVSTALVLFAACLLLGAAIVFPLWKFATTNSTLYTIVCIIALAVLFIFKIIQSVKKAGAVKSLSVFLRLALLILSLAAIFTLVITDKRLLALFVLIGSIILYGLIHVLFQNKIRK